MASSLKQRILNYLAQKKEVAHFAELLQLEPDRKTLRARLSECLRAGQIIEDAGGYRIAHDVQAKIIGQEFNPDNNRALWFLDISELMRAALRIATAPGDDDATFVYDNERFEATVTQRLGYLSVSILPVLSDGGVDLENPLMSFEIRPEVWWIEQLKAAAQ